MKNKRKFRKNDFKLNQLTPWGAIQNGGFENSTLDPWYGSGFLVKGSRYAFSGTNYCELNGRFATVIAQYTLPLDVSRNYRLSFYVRRITPVTTGSLYMTYSAADNFTNELPLSTFRFQRGTRIWRQVILTIPVPLLGAQEPVIFIGLRDSTAFAAIAIDNVTLKPIIPIDPPIR